MDERQTLPPPPGTVEHCYRHPDVPTGVHCTRCGRPICPDCMVPAPVGYHCPQCVAEARREFRKGPGRRVAVANAKAMSLTTLLLVAIGAMFVVEVAEGGAASIGSGPPLQTLVDLGGTVPALIAQGEWWRMLTSIFLHAGIFHLLLNAWGLYLFGTVVERTFGRPRFLAIFLIAGFTGNVASYIAASSPAEILTVGVGASGSIFGLVGAVLVYSFQRRGTAIGRAYLQWAVMIIVLNLVIGSATPGIDNLAHLGGAAGGALAALAIDVFGRRNALAEWLAFALIVAVGAFLTVQHSAEVNRTLHALAIR